MKVESLVLNMGDEGKSYVVYKYKIMLVGYRKVIFSVKFFFDGKWVGSFLVDKIICIWSVMDGKCECVFEGYSDGIFDFVWSSDLWYICFVFDDKILKIWDL